MKMSKIKAQAIEEAYNILADQVISNLPDDLEENYNHYNYLDFSDEAFEFIAEHGIEEVLEPAIQSIEKKIREVLYK